MNNVKTNQRGVNLVELIVTISIASISLSLGLPAFDQLRTRADRSAAMIELVSSAKLARSEAAIRSIPVSICPTTDGVSCTGDNDWSNGWVVFLDPDRNLTVADASDILDVTRFERTQFTLVADNQIGSGITYGLFGFATPDSGQLTYTDSLVSRRVQLNPVGHLEIIELGAPSST